MPRRLRQIALVAAIAPLVVLVGMRAAWAAYSCRDGQVRTSCCCPQPAVTASDLAPQAEAACCEVTTGDATDAPTAREAERSRLDQVAAVLVMTPIDAVHGSWDRTASLSTTRPARPPPPSVPKYLANRSIVR